MRRNTSLLLLLVFCFLSLVYFGQGIAGTLQDVTRRGKLIAGVKTEYPPLGFLDNKGINKGFDIDIAKALTGMGHGYGYTYTYHNKTGYSVRVIVRLYGEASRSSEIKANESHTFSTKVLLKSWVAEALIENKWQRVLDMTCDLLPGNHTFFIDVNEASGPGDAVNRSWNAIVK